jgi:hypothetical protein
MDSANSREYPYKRLGAARLKYGVLIAVFIIIALSIQTVPVVDATYIQAEITDKPEARGAHSMAFDTHNGVAVIFGGFSLTGGFHSIGDTWTYSYTDNSWTELTLSPSPSSRSNHAMVYCNQTNEIILYGGAVVTDTWSFDCETQTWSQVVTATNPGVHRSLALAYDPQENVVILFGGFGGDDWETDDTWEFDCDIREWSEVFPTTTPLARYGNVMVYDESINQIVMTAGNTASHGHQDDTWTYDASANTWTELTPTSDPDNLKWPSMTYDSMNQKCILFGGQIGDSAVDRTWIYDGQLNTWIRHYPDDAPVGRINTGLAFDPVSNVTILFGGYVIDDALYDDTWTYSYESDVWTDMEGGSDSTTPTTPTTPTGQGFDPLLLALLVPVTAAVVVVVLIVRRRT